MYGDNLFVFEDFTKRPAGELVRYAIDRDGLGDSTGNYYSCNVTTDNRVRCRENGKTIASTLGSAVAGNQYFTIDCSGVKKGNKLHVAAMSLTGELRFYLAIPDGTGFITNHLIKSFGNTNCLMVIDTELGILTLRTVSNGQISSVVTVELSDSVRSHIINKNFRVGIYQSLGGISSFGVSEIDVDGGGYPLGLITNSSSKKTVVNGNLLDGDITVSNLLVKLVDNTSHQNELAFHKLVVKDKYRQLGKKIVMIDSDGVLKDPDHIDDLNGSRLPLCVWFMDKTKLQTSYTFKLVDI